MLLFSSISTFIQALTLVVSLHPIHISVTEIEFDENDKALEVMMRVFMDDFELTMRNRLNRPELDILSLPANDLDQMVSGYLKDHFKITLDGKLQNANYLGHERDAEAFVFYIEVSNVKRFKSIHIFNDIITETHDDQSNLVHVTVKGTVRSLRLNRDTPADKLTFEPK